MVGLEEFGAQLHESGACHAWFGTCDDETRRVAGEANGPLFETLLRATEFVDVPCADLLKDGVCGFCWACVGGRGGCFCLSAGAKMVDKLPRSGLGRPVDCDVVASLDELWSGRAASNAEVLRSVREDEHSDWMLKAAQEDALKGRMSWPVQVEEHGFNDEGLLHPRFCVAKDLSDGSVKRRGVDHFSWSANGGGKKASVNGSTLPQEKLSHDTLDVLAEILFLFWSLVGEVPALFKTDIDSAFRRIPVRAGDRWACWVAFAAEGKAFVAQHFACPFGAVASVHAWERIGAGLSHIAQILLMLPILRYVDDYFGPDRLDTVEHGMQCFVRLVRLLLGPGSVADDKTAWGCGLDVLGVDIEMSQRGFTFRPSAEKRVRWRANIQAALNEHRRLPGAASKLAGRLSWACSRLFHRFGRATLRAIFDQKSRHSGDLSPELRRCLQWWLDVLDMELAELRTWEKSVTPLIHMFCDAASTPPHLGVVLVDAGHWYWTHAGVSAEVLNQFRRRRDNQIMGLELLAISLGLSTFATRLQGRRVIVHSDNKGSEARCRSCLRLRGVLFYVRCCGAGLFQTRIRQIVRSRATGARAVDKSGGFGIICLR